MVRWCPFHKWFSFHNSNLRQFFFIATLFLSIISWKIAQHFITGIMQNFVVIIPFVYYIAIELPLSVKTLVKRPLVLSILWWTFSGGRNDPSQICVAWSSQWILPQLTEPSTMMVPISQKTFSPMMPVTEQVLKITWYSGVTFSE